MIREFKHVSKVEKLRLLEDVKSNPEQYLGHETLAPLAASFCEKVELRDFEAFDLIKESGMFNIFGQKQIEVSAIKQMELAMHLLRLRRIDARSVTTDMDCPSVALQ